MGGTVATDFAGTGAIRITSTTFDQATVGSSVGINVASEAAGLTLEDVDIQGYDDGVSTGAATVMTNGTIQHCNRGLAAWGSVQVDVDHYTFHYNDTGIRIDFTPLKLRNSQVEYGVVGVRAEGFPKPDLGVAGEDGLNTFRANSTSSYDGTSVVYNGPTWARGNTWEPNAQGSEPNGGYIVGTTIYGPVSGANFIIDSDVPIHF